MAVSETVMAVCEETEAAAVSTMTATIVPLAIGDQDRRLRQETTTGIAIVDTVIVIEIVDTVIDTSLQETEEATTEVGFP